LAEAQVPQRCGSPQSPALHGPLVALNPPTHPGPAPLQAGERNPALGLALASACSSDPLVVAPLAVSVFAQNVLGSNLSVFYWGRRSAA
jgi:hypothetical protein